MYQRPNSDRWWIGFRHDGQQFLKSSGQTDKKKAEAELAKVEAMLAARRANVLTVDVFQALTGQTLPSVTLKAALDDWLNEARGSTGARTLEKYVAFAGEMTLHFRPTDKTPLASEITREELQTFLAQRRAKVSASTANMSRKVMAIFFNRCKALGSIRDNPVEAIKPFKGSREEERVRRPFTETELAALFTQAPDDFWKYMVVAGFYTGLRLGDLVTMPVGAVDFEARTINLLTRKTSAPMHIPIAPPLFSILTGLKAERKGTKATDPFWPEHAKRYEESGSGWFGQRFYDLLLVKAGLATSRPHRTGGKSRSDKRRVNEVSFHCFRHSYVSTLARLGQNQQIVKALAGHSDDSINDLYTKLPAETLRGAIALLPDITKTEVVK